MRIRSISGNNPIGFAGAVSKALCVLVVFWLSDAIPRAGAASTLPACQENEASWTNCHGSRTLSKNETYDGDFLTVSRMAQVA
jgi:hypothetical protein